MNYEKLYFAFIEKYKNQVFGKDVYTEKHHIIPRHAGGDDSKENFIKLTHRQHVFAHHLLWKAYNRLGDRLAYVLMTNTDIDKLRLIRSEVGKRVGLAQKDRMRELGKLRGPIQGRHNVESGLLDSIRPLANNEVQRSKASKLGRDRWASGKLVEALRKAIEVWTGSNHTEEFKENKRQQMLEWASIPENREQLREMNQRAVATNIEKGVKHSEEVIKNAERNEEFLHKNSFRSKNKFVSPEGLEFDSPIFAAKYYGNVDYYIIENWCKRNQHGWSRKPKAA